MKRVELFKSFKCRLEQNRSGESRPSVTAIIVAAGKGERMESEINKQFIPLCDIPVIARTLAPFQASRTITQIIVVTRPEGIVETAGVVHEFGFDKVVRIVRGGPTRQQSATAGLAAAGNTDFIAIHDGARPLVTPACIDRVVQKAFETKAATAAVRLKDTVKISDDQQNVVSTPDRSSMWSVQTPQVFETEIYRRALEKAKSDELDYTDDCQLIENAGGIVRLVEGEYANIKITTRDDIPIAEAILRARGEA
jgi:2-C-methyl-D-erythritol 4-phosphate cytidylyltransferase